MKASFTGLVVIIGLFSISGLSQARSITQADLIKISYDAEIATKKVFPRRLVAEKKNFENGKLTSSSIVTSESDSENNEHIVDIYKEEQTTKIRELIRIGETYYCRDDKTPWKQSTKYCGAIGASAFPNTKTSKITVEEIVVNGARQKYYSSYVTHQGWLGSNDESQPLKFIDTKFWVNENGSSNRWEQTKGLLASKEILQTTSLDYQYKVDVPRITAPMR